MYKQLAYYRMVLILITFQIARALDPLAIMPVEQHSEEFCELVMQLAPKEFQQKSPLFSAALISSKAERMLLWGESGLGKTTAFEVLVQRSGRPGIRINAGKLGGKSQKAVDDDLKEIFAKLPPQCIVGIDNLGQIVHESRNNGADVAIQVCEFLDTLEKTDHPCIPIMNEIGTIDPSLQTRLVGKTILFSKLKDPEKIKKMIALHLGPRHECEDKYLEQLSSVCKDFSHREIYYLAKEGQDFARVRGSSVASQDLNEALKKVQQSRADLAGEKREGWLDWGMRWAKNYSVTKEAGAGLLAIGGMAGGALKWAASKLPVFSRTTVVARSVISSDPARTTALFANMRVLVATGKMLPGLF